MKHGFVSPYQLCLLHIRGILTDILPSASTLNKTENYALNNFSDIKPLLILILSNTPIFYTTYMVKVCNGQWQFCKGVVSQAESVELGETGEGLWYSAEPVV